MYKFPAPKHVSFRKYSNFHSAWHQNRNPVSLKKVSSFDFQQFNHFRYWKMCLWASMLAVEWKGRAFIEKVNSRCFCWFPAAIFVDSFCPPVWRLHTKLYKGAWNVSANNSETVGQKDLRFGQIVYILVFYNISFSWLLPLDSFQFNFLYRVSIAWQWKRRIASVSRMRCSLSSGLHCTSRHHNFLKMSKDSNVFGSHFYRILIPISHFI